MHGSAEMRGELRAFIFDMDGVVTDTAEAHFAAWKQVFDDFLRRRSGGGNFEPFEREDYLSHVDGIPRYEGIRRFLASRGIQLPEGEPEDEGGEETIRGIGSLKNSRFNEWLGENRVPVFDDARALIATLRENGMRTGVFSASRNARRVLESAGVRHLFDVAVDGLDAEALGLPGKPDPAVLVESARRLGCGPESTAVVEDAVLGVEAGAKGRFSLVVGINRRDEVDRAQCHALRSRGADLVVRDLRRLLTDDGSGLRTVRRLPSAWVRRGDLSSLAGKRRLAVFLDYDGTLTPIVRDHREADIAREMVAAVAQLAERFPTVIISGRDLNDVRGRVGLEQVFYAGSHGLEIAGPSGLHHRPDRAEEFLQPIEAADGALRAAVAGIDGAEIERKTFSVAVHFRNVAEEDVGKVEQAVDAVVARQPKLRKGRGRKVFEIRPRAPWDKGRAVDWLLDNTALGEGNALPLYIGDDLTDEDAFGAIHGRGISIVVRGGDRVTTADYALDDTEDVRRFLGWLTGRPAEPAQ